MPLSPGTRLGPYSIVAPLGAASVLKNDLDWKALPNDLPGPILRLLRRRLTPDRRRRLRDIGEARVAIADYLSGKIDTTHAQRRVRIGGRRSGGGDRGFAVR